MSYQRDFENRLNVAMVGVGSHTHRNILPAMQGQASGIFCRKR